MFSTFTLGLFDNKGGLGLEADQSVVTGYPLSSTSRNSWLSKIYLCQHIMRKILKYEWGEQGKMSDAAQIEWLRDDESAYFAWSDQMIAFKAVWSKYYPRGVASIL